MWVSSYPPLYESLTLLEHNYGVSMIICDVTLLKRLEVNLLYTFLVQNLVLDV